MSTGKRAITMALAVALGLSLAACSLDGVDSRETSAELDADRPAEKTWEAAAVAEARRLDPDLTNPRVDRVEVTPLDERVRVQADGGYCHIFGGKHDSRVGWQANDLGPC